MYLEKQPVPVPWCVQDSWSKPGDEVIADKGFLIQVLLIPNQCPLSQQTSFLTAKGQ